MNTKIENLLKTNTVISDDLKRTSAADFMKSKELIAKIFHTFITDSVSYNPEDTTKLIDEYLETGERILYSEVSNNIFAYFDYEIGNFQTNLEYFVLHVYNEIGKQVPYRKTYIKLYDHCQLALSQRKNLKTDDYYFQNMINSNLVPVQEQLHREVYTQLISLVGIFTALSFLIFGGINSLDNIFQNMTDIPLLKLMILGCVWGLCIINMIFVFMYFISKLTRTEIKTNSRLDANFVQRYPFTCFSNFMIFIVLAICSWLYFIDESNIGSWFLEMSNSNQVAICIAGFIIIGIIFVVFGLYLINKCKTKPRYR